MQWMIDLPASHPVAWSVLVLSVTGALGLALAKLGARGVTLGITGVLFAGIGLGHVGVFIEADILEFVREFGLILFVFTIGLQLGPGFFSSLRRQGLRLNLLAAAIVTLGAVVAWGVSELAGIDIVATLGLFSGATTNTPSLAATQQTLKTLGDLSAERVSLPALAYAVAYPGGVLGIILALLLIRGLFGIDAEREARSFSAEQRSGAEPLERMNLTVDNPNLAGLPIGGIPGRGEIQVAISRIRRQGGHAVHTATDDTVMQLGDTILAVGSAANLEKLRMIVGHRSDANLMRAHGQVVYRRVVVTRKQALGRTLHELNLQALHNVTITRIARAEIEIPARPQVALQFGDVLQVVGEEAAITRVIAEVGNSPKALNETNFISIFVGLAIGVFVGMLPIGLPDMPVPVRLGLAGGPLIVAILLSRVGHMGPMVWYMPASANTALRELGIILFLACVGLKAGQRFFEIAWSQQGLIWLAAGLCVTMIPILLVGLFARLALKLNYAAISGLLAGSMTDPPALAFANAIARSDAPAVAYATVYPLTMLMRIVIVQGLVLMLC